MNQILSFNNTQYPTRSDAVFALTNTVMRPRPPRPSAVVSRTERRDHATFNPERRSFAASRTKKVRMPAPKDGGSARARPWRDENA